MRANGQRTHVVYCSVSASQGGEAHARRRNPSRLGTQRRGHESGKGLRTGLGPARSTRHEGQRPTGRREEHEGLDVGPWQVNWRLQLDRRYRKATGSRGGSTPTKSWYDMGLRSAFTGRSEHDGYRDSDVDCGVKGRYSLVQQKREKGSHSHGARSSLVSCRQCSRGIDHLAYDHGFGVVERRVRFPRRTTQERGSIWMGNSTRLPPR